MNPKYDQRIKEAETRQRNAERYLHQCFVREQHCVEELKEATGLFLRAGQHYHRTLIGAEADSADNHGKVTK